MKPPFAFRKESVICKDSSPWGAQGQEELKPIVEGNKKPGKPLRILLLEDNPTDAKLELLKLQTSGLDIHADTSRTAEEFRRLIHSNNYDIVLADYRLPDWTGLDAIRYLRLSGISVPFVLVTGTLGDELAIECIKAGASDYILKENLERLPVAVSRAIEEHLLRTERDRAEQELRHSEERYRLLFEANPNPMWVYNPVTLKFLAVNETAVRRYGYSRAEFLSMSVTDIRPPEEVPRFLEYHKNAGIQILTDDVPWKHLRKDGTAIDVEITSKAIDFLGQTARIVLVVEITDRLRAEGALRESREHYRSIVEGAPFGIYQSDRSGHILTANPALLTMLGYDSHDEVSKVDLNNIYLDPAERQRYIKCCEEAFGQVCHFESKWRRKNGSPMTVKLSGRASRVQDGSTIYEVFVEDVSEQRSLEQQFRYAQKMEAIGRLAGGVAHDFNNLLMVITSFGQLIQEFASDSQKVARYAGQIQDAGRKAAAVIRQLLAFSRRQIQELRVVNMNEVAVEFCKLLPRILGEDIEMVVKTASEDCLVRADRGQIEQVIMNLAVNARDAMPEGGKLTIETAIAQLDDQYGWQHEAAIPPGHYIMLAVTDTGCGMSAETQSHVFEPFFTTKEVGKGTGLGLATVYGIVKQSRGFLWVYSELGNGTTFKIYLPQVALHEAVEIPIPQDEGAVPFGNETILIVEDEASLLAANREFLESKGYTILEANNGAAALHICNEYEQPIHLLLTDIVMPGLSGPDLATAVLAVRPKIRVIYMSGYTASSMDPRVLAENANFLQKPCSLPTIARKIRTVLDR